MQTITDQQKTQLRQQMHSLTAMPLEAGQVFYEALFEKFPDARALFADNIEDQAHKLIDMVFLVVHFLDGVEALTLEVEELGRRHIAYGTSPEYLHGAKDAFIQALEATFTPWTPDDRDAWDALLTLIIDTMIRGMRDSDDTAPQSCSA